MPWSYERGWGRRHQFSFFVLVAGVVDTSLQLMAGSAISRGPRFILHGSFARTMALPGNRASSHLQSKARKSNLMLSYIDIQARQHQVLKLSLADRVITFNCVDPKLA